MTVDPLVSAAQAETLEQLSETIHDCRACPRLVAWREQVAREKRAAYAAEDYWGRPVSGFGDPKARLLIVGLAPAAHGANRTGRMFTGDRSGDWLFRALSRAGFANQSTSVSRNDGLELRGAYVTAPVHCAPPANKPTPDEIATCQPWIERELDLLMPTVRVVVCLGAIGFQALWRVLNARGEKLVRPRPKFAHALEVCLPSGITIISSFHPSQQNTFTGRLTEPMFDAIFSRAAAL